MFLIFLRAIIAVYLLEPSESMIILLDRHFTHSL